jgi:ribosomal protein S18 acetylase RimI-like enzyme
MAAATALRIAEAREPQDIATARGLFEEYAASLGLDLCFQGFEEELATLPGSYAPPNGRLMLARFGNEIAGCVALRQLEQEVCEMKRLYVRPVFRRLGVGRMLAGEITRQARIAGYQCMRLDTLPTMASALALYRQLGFREIRPYRSNPVKGAFFLELQLDRPAR